MVSQLSAYGFYSQSEETASSHLSLTKTPCTLKACLFYAIVVQDFQAQSSDNLEAKSGDAIVIVAVLHREWFIGKTIGHSGCTGMIPVTCVTVYDLVTGCVLCDIDDLIARRNLMNVQGGKWNTIKFKENSIDLTIIDPESPDKLVQVNVSFPPQAHDSSPIITFGHTISIHDEKHQKQIYPWIYHPLVLSHGSLFQVKTSPSPFPCYGHCLSVSSTQSGELYMFGGKTSYHAKPNNDCYIIDIKKSSVTLVKTKRKPSKRAGHASIMLRDTFIIWGGARNFGGKFALDQGLYMLDIGTRVWTTVHVKGSVPIGRFRHSACLACDTLFIVFGGQLSESIFLNDLWFVDLANINVEVTWHLIHPTSRERPGQRAGHVCVFHKNQLIIFGGTDGSYKYNDTWCFDFQTRKWSEWVCEGKVPEARDGHAAAIIDGIMYIFGGFNTDEKELEDLYALSLSSQIWYSFRYHDIGLSPGKRIGHAMVAIGPEIYSVGGRSESLPFSMAQKNSNYIHVLDTRRLDFD
ncbi:hypothetical protein VKT23_005075 [Stygiomarasmius scandens]|uniref:SH3 domain-containing protein n=1 Tax=Marasmiellus scandens TaxID=2682957 RepID=A0ABR1JS83_9AGAR